MCPCAAPLIALQSNERSLFLWTFTGRGLVGVTGQDSCACYWSRLVKRASTIKVRFSFQPPNQKRSQLVVIERHINSMGNDTNSWYPSAKRKVSREDMTSSKFLLKICDGWHTLFTSSPFLPPPFFYTNPRPAPSSSNPSTPSSSNPLTKHKCLCYATV